MGWNDNETVDNMSYHWFHTKMKKYKWLCQEKGMLQKHFYTDDLLGAK